MQTQTHIQVLRTIRSFLIALCCIVVTTTSNAQLATTSSADTIICTSTAVQLNTTPSGGTSYTYSWTPATGLSSTTIANPLATPAATTTYYVTVTDVPSTNTITDTVTIFVQNIPPPLIVHPQSDTICLGDTLQLDVFNKVECQAGPVGTCQTTESFNDVGDGTLFAFTAETNPFFKENNFVQQVNSNKHQYIYKASELNDAGIFGPTTIKGLSFDITISGGDMTYNNLTFKMGCTTDSIASTNFIPGLTTVYNPKTFVFTTTQWEEFTFDQSFPWDGESNIVVEVCFSNPTVLFGRPFVRYKQYTSSIATFTSANSDVCSNTTGTVSIARPNTRFHHCDIVHLSNLTYSWTPATGLSSTVVKDPLANPAVNTDYIVTYTDNNGCVGEDTASISVVADFNFTINNDTTFCSPDTLDLISTTTGGPSVSYKWTSSAWIENDSIQSTRGFFNESATVNYLATSPAGCEKEGSFNVDFVFPVSIEILTADTTICQGEQIPLDISSNTGGCGTIPSFSCSSPDHITFQPTSTFPSSGVTISPFDGNFGLTDPGQKKQFLLTATELAAMTNSDAITSVGFSVINIGVNPSNRDNFTIRIGCTNLASFPFGNQNFETGLQTVYTPKTYNVSTGWNDIVFDNPYVWDGVSNVIIEICWQNTGTMTFPGTTVNWSNVGTAMTKLAWNSADVCNEVQGFATTIRPEMRINYCNNPPNPNYDYSWTPAVDVSNNLIAEPDALPTANGYLNLLVSDPLTGCSDEDSVLIQVAPNFATSATNDTILCDQDTLPLFVSHNSPNPVTYNWMPSGEVSNSSMSNPTVYVNKRKEIISEVRSNLGCIKWDTINIGLQDPIDVNILANSGPFCEGDTHQLDVTHLLQCGLSNVDQCVPSDSAYIGTGAIMSSNDNITPFSAIQRSSKRQFIIRKAELQAAGITGPAQLSSISFFITNLGKSDYEDFTISMRCLNANSMNVSFRTNLKTVFDTKDVSLKSGKNWFDFDKRYNWDGESNIVVEICYNNTNTGASSEVLYTVPNPVFTCATYIIGMNMCGVNSGTTFNRRPDVEFKYCLTPPSNYSYNWTPNPIYDNPFAQNPIVSFDSTGKLKVTLTDLNSGCEIPDSVIVDVKSFEVEALEDTSLCTSEDYQLNVLTNAQQPTYLWTPAAELNNNTIPNPVITTPNGTMYIVEVTDSAGCAKSDTVLINLLPRPNAVVTPSSITVCRGEEVQLIGAGGNTYLWTPPSTLSASNISSPVARPTESTVYYLQVTNLQGCKDVDSAIVNVHASPILDLGPDTSYCNGGSILLNAGSGFLTYEWQNNSKDSTFLVDSDGLYYIMVSDKFNCIFYDSVNVAIAPAPVADIPYTSVLCRGDSVILDAMNPGATYLWSNGETSRQIIVKDSGFFKVEINDGRCIGSDSTLVSVYDYPITYLSDIEYYCEKEMPFGKTLIAGSDEYRYLWDNGQVTNSIVVTSEGTYGVLITNGGKCTIEKEIEVRQVCSEVIFVPNTFTPNDDWTNDFFTITALNLDEMEFRIFNRWGEVIFYSTSPNFEWDGKANGQEVPDGVYAWRIDYKIKLADGSYESREEFGSLTILK